MLGGFIFRSRVAFRALQGRRTFVAPLVASVARNPLAGGLFLVTFGIPVLVINERRAVKQDHLRERGEKACLEMNVDKDYSMTELSDFDEKLVHAVGHLGTDGSAQDTFYKVNQIKYPKALKLRTTTEMFQYREEKQENRTKDQNGKEVVEITYNYSQVWSSYSETIQNPDPNTNRHNPPVPSGLPMGQHNFVAPEMYFGKEKYFMTPELRDQLRAYQDLPVDKSNCKFEDPDLKMTTNGLYTKSGNPNYPKIGDIRVKFEYIPEETYTTVSKFQKSLREFSAFKGKLEKSLASEGEIKAPQQTEELSKAAGGEGTLFIPKEAIKMAEQLVLAFAPLQLCLLAKGKLDKTQAFRVIKENDESNTWGLRVFGSLAIVAGCMVVANTIPLVPTSMKGGGAIALGIGIAYQTIQDATADIQARKERGEDLE